MRFLTRTVLYVLCLFTLLGYLSYRLYSSPSQVKARVERYLSRFLRQEARVEGCQEPFLNVLSVKSISIPSSPPLDERTLLILEDLRVDDPSPRRGFRRFLRKSMEDAGASPFSLRARNAVLCVDRKIEGPPQGEMLRTNFDDLLRPEALLAELRSSRAHVFLDRFRVQLQALRPPEAKVFWRFEGRDAEVRPWGDDGVSLEGDLLEGEFWSDGQFQVTWVPGSPLHLRAEIEDLRGPERWLPLLNKGYRDFWERFRPEGSLNVEILDAEWSPGGLGLKATVRHYDTAARLGDTGLALEHLRGSSAISESEVILGGDAKESKAGPDALLAELWGATVRVTGKLGPKGGQIRLAFPPFQVESLVFPGGETTGNLGSFLTSFRPAGAVEGELVVSFKPGAKEELTGELRWMEIGCPRFPLLSKITGSLSVEPLGGGVAGELEPHRGGRGKLKMKEIHIAGLEAGEGDVLYSWDDEKVRFEFTNVQLGDGTGDGGGGRVRGSIIGSVEWGLKEGKAQWDLRWLGLAISTGLFRADGNGATKSAPGEKGGPGTMTLSKIAVPAGVLWPSSEELQLESGKCAFLIEGSRFVVKSIKLLGEKASLRAAGEIDVSGDLDLILLVDKGPSYVAVYELPDESRPSEWKQAARGSYRAFRITGSLSAPRSREIGALDPAFVEGR